MQKPDVFPRFIQLCFELLHISGFKYFTWQRVPVIYHPVGETELPQVQPAWLLHDFLSMATGFSWIHCEEVTCFQIVNTRHDTECLNHIHASSPVQKAGLVQIQCSQSVIVAPVPKVWYQSCRSSLCIFQLGNIYLQMQTPDAVRIVHVTCGLISEVNKSLYVIHTYIHPLQLLQ